MTISSFKNLSDFHIAFDDSSITTTLVGRNGMGKSNLIEVLVRIFTALDGGQNALRAVEFGFDLSYVIRGREVRVVHEVTPTTQSNLTVDGKRAPLKQLLDDAELLPDTVFAYYSGPSNRLEALFEPSLIRFRDAMIRGDVDTRQRMIYGRPVHSKLVLLAFLAEGNLNSFPFLSRELGISAVESVLFILREPYWKRGKIGPTNKRYMWGADGTVKVLLDALFDHCLAPLVLDQRVGGEVGRSRSQQQLYMFLESGERLTQLVDQLAGVLLSRAREFFTTLESAVVSDLIEDVHVLLRKEHVDGTVTFSELSEGEQQLLMVLGLLRFTKEEETLFLLDEPDTHLNPTWSLRFLDLVDEALGEHENCQLLMASHDPVAISLLTKEQVRQFDRSETGRITAHQPREDPIELGIPGVLLSELFGFRSLIAPPLADLIEERQLLRLREGELTSEEQDRLTFLDNRLSELDLSAVSDDPLYASFLREMGGLNREGYAAHPTLTREESIDQRKLARQVIEAARAAESET